MKHITYFIIVLSFIIPPISKSIYYLINDLYTTLIITTAFAGGIFFSFFSYLAWKGIRVFKWLTCLHLLIVGAFMLPYFIAPAVDSIGTRLFLGFIGLFWILSSVWVFRNIPIKHHNKGSKQA